MDFIFISSILFLWMTSTAARKSKKSHIPRENDKSSEVLSWNVNRHVDLRGNLRKTFFVVSALSSPEKNMVCSPISALMPLGKLSLGAESHALDELLLGVGVSKKSKIRHHFKPLIMELRYLPGGKLDIASKLYVSINSHVYRNFVEEAVDIFDSTVEKIDFQYPTYASEQINAWVASQTNYLIKNMISPSDIPTSSSMILVNAVYFNGRWVNAFDKFKNVTFYGPKITKSIPMMTTVGTYNYTKSESLNSQIIKIPYAGEKASFVIVLPTARNGLGILLSQLKLAPEMLDSAMTMMVETRVQLTMPKFKIESLLNLNDMYKKIGVKKIFNDTKSGLTRIIRNENIYVTTAKQKTYIDVNEYGTEAAASSSVIVGMSAHPKPEQFLADHPFLFFIMVRTQQLFSGQFVKPD